MAETLYTYASSPIGNLLLVGDETSLRGLYFPSGPKAATAHPKWRENSSPFAETKAQLAAYFAGELQDFDLPLKPHGTLFQQEVWFELANIPYGQTISYATLAKRVSRPNASRAVGAANGANPLPIVLPCHRVVGSNGSLTGFGGGLETKAFLLNLERGQPRLAMFG